jgi:flagellin-like protein
MYNRMKKDGVSPVIAVILMVAITVVLAGVLYVWVTSLADTSEEKTETLRLSVDDASVDVAITSVFGPGKDLLKVEQIGGDPIDWSELTIYLNTKGSDARVTLTVSTIAGVTYGTGAAETTESTTGQIVILVDAAGGTFYNGDYVLLTITKGSAQVWSSSSAIQVQ